MSTVPIWVYPLLLSLIVLIILVLVRRGRGHSGDIVAERLAEYGGRPLTLEELELSQPFSQRILVPIVQGMAHFISRFAPQANIENTRHKLELAGNPNNWRPMDFLGVRGVAAVIVGGLAFALTFFRMGNMLWVVVGTPIGLLLGYMLPVIWLGSKIRARQNEIVKSLPDALDLLTISVEAGLGFDAAMAKVAEKWDNELSQAFDRVITEIRLGKLRREALRDMADSMDVPDVTSFVAAIIQADQLGVSIAKVLRIQSEQMRIRRRQRAEEKAHQAPVKMLFPMVFLIFPAIWIVLLGPAVLVILHSGVIGNI